MKDALRANSVYRDPVNRPVHLSDGEAERERELPAGRVNPSRNNEQINLHQWRGGRPPNEVRASPE